VKVVETLTGHEHRNRIQGIVRNGNLMTADWIAIEKARGNARQVLITARIEKANITSSGWPVSNYCTYSDTASTTASIVCVRAYAVV